MRVGLVTGIRIAERDGLAGHQDGPAMDDQSVDARCLLAVVSVISIGPGRAFRISQSSTAL